ncbi:MAG: XdhC family protein [Acidimicrobiia bacterium]
MTVNLEDMANELRLASEPYVRATIVWARKPSSGSPGDRAIVQIDGSLHGWVGGACAEPVLTAEARDVLESGEPRLLFLGPHEESPRQSTRVVPMSCASEGALEIFMEPVIPVPQVVVVGRSPAVEKLARLLQVMNWGVTIVDEEGKGGELLRDLPVVSRFVDVDASPSAVVVATQGHYDEDALEWAISTDARYIGIVASERRGAALIEYLRALPADETDIARVKVRAGIDLGVIDHEETAVSILAELVQVRSRGALQTGAAIQMAQEAPSSIDPVCGMSVEIAGARFTHEHLGETVYFCCPGCRHAYIANPEEFAPA